MAAWPAGRRWTPAARLEAVITTAAMDEATRSACCREQGLFSAELEAWKRDATAGPGKPRAVGAADARLDRRWVPELEREPHRIGGHSEVQVVDLSNPTLPGITAVATGRPARCETPGGCGVRRPQWTSD